MLFYVDGGGGGYVASSLTDETVTDWGCDTTSINTSALVGDGNSNTQEILNNCPSAGIAARYCDDASFGGYNDWFLPSQDELNEMYLNIGKGSTSVNSSGVSNTNIANFGTNFYWSSTQQSTTNAYVNELANPVVTTGALDKSTPQYVRAIRAVTAPV